MTHVLRLPATTDLNVIRGIEEWLVRNISKRDRTTTVIKHVSSEWNAIHNYLMRLVQHDQPQELLIRKIYFDTGVGWTLFICIPVLANCCFVLYVAIDDDLMAIQFKLTWGGETVDQNMTSHKLKELQ